MSPAKAFYEYSSSFMEPWDGPASSFHRWKLCWSRFIEMDSDQVDFM